MSCIAYVTDSKMLELHRLNNHKTMNFWRLSNNMSFSDFSYGDLVFFLSKDKIHSKDREKGIVGFGRLVSMNLCSVNRMWEKYQELNGYKTLEDFTNAISKVSKDKKLPKKISSFYLEDVCFFQPVYLSECGMNISNNIESYIYLDNSISERILDLSKDSCDLWSSFSDNNESIIQEKELRVLFETHNRIKDIPVNQKYERTVKKKMEELVENSQYRHMNNSLNEIYYLKDRYLEIVFYHDSKTDDRLLIGQSRLYFYYLSKYCNEGLIIKFRTSDNDSDLEYLLNN